jgi:hypothetical protein
VSTVTTIRLDREVDSPAFKEALASAHKNMRGLATAAVVDQADLIRWSVGDMALPVAQVAAIERVLDVEGMFTGGLDDEQTSPAASQPEPADEPDAVAGDDSADAPAAPNADDASAAGEPPTTPQKFEVFINDVGPVSVADRIAREIAADTAGRLRSAASDLDGATTAPPAGAEPSDAGEFAAMWNGWDAEHRQKFLAGVKDNAAIAHRCFDRDHQAELASSDRALAAANDRHREMSEQIDELKHALDAEREARASANDTIGMLEEKLRALIPWPAPLDSSPLGLPGPAVSDDERERERAEVLRVVLDELAGMDTNEVNMLLIGVKILARLEVAVA